jgi:hypothetical protein
VTVVIVRADELAVDKDQESVRDASGELQIPVLTSTLWAKN